MKRKMFFALIGTVVTLTSIIGLTGCSGNEANDDVFKSDSDIAVISREDGSGTRGAFTELFNIIEENAQGEKIDKTTLTADITQSTGVVLTSVADNINSIGYVSLGSLNNTVKALSIDGAAATTDNIKNDKAKGKITIMGSSSVAPVMEKLKEGYNSINSQVVIEISQSDSTNGMNSVSDGICDIGMASREIKESEYANGLNGQIIALDGIAVIVNQKNTIDELTSKNVKDIYVGSVVTWDGLE